MKKIVIAFLVTFLAVPGSFALPVFALATLADDAKVAEATDFNLPPAPAPVANVEVYDGDVSVITLLGSQTYVDMPEAHIVGTPFTSINMPTAFVKVTRPTKTAGL